MLPVHGKFVMDLRAEVREKMAAIKGLTIKACLTKGSLLPVLAEQQKLGQSTIKTIYQHLKPFYDINDSQVIGIISGSYARGTCIAGSDFDLDILYGDRLRRDIFPFERQFRKCLTTAFDLEPWDSHVSLLYAASAEQLGGTGIKDLGVNLFFGRLVTKLLKEHSSGIRNHLYKTKVPFEKYLFSKLDRFIFLMGRRFAFRSAEILEKYLVLNFSWHYIYGEPTDVSHEFIFGDKERYDRMERDVLEKQTAIIAHSGLKDGFNASKINLLNRFNGILISAQSNMFDLVIKGEKHNISMDEALHKRGYIKNIIKNFGLMPSYVLISALKGKDSFIQNGLAQYSMSEKCKESFMGYHDKFFRGIEGLLKALSLFYYFSEDKRKYSLLREYDLMEVVKNMGCQNVKELKELLLQDLNSISTAAIFALDHSKNHQ